MVQSRCYTGFPHHGGLCLRDDTIPQAVLFADLFNKPLPRQNRIAGILLELTERPSSAVRREGSEQDKRSEHEVSCRAIDHESNGMPAIWFWRRTGSRPRKAASEASGALRRRSSGPR